MKIQIKKLILSVATIAIFAGLISSCKKNDEEFNRTCKVAFILNLTNAAGDTTFVDVMAGELAENAPVPARSGFTFNGWVTNSADANPDPTKNAAVPKFPVYDISVNPIYLDMILYARWIK